MISSARFTFSPVKSLSLWRLTARAKRQLKPASFALSSNATSASAGSAYTTHPTLNLRWDHSVLDHLHSPLTRFHD